MVGKYRHCQTKKWMLDKEALEVKLQDHKQNDTTYLKNASLILELAQRAPTLFQNAKFDQKRRFAQKLFLNCVLKDRILDLELRKPYELILVILNNWKLA